MKLVAPGDIITNINVRDFLNYLQIPALIIVYSCKPPKRYHGPNKYNAGCFEQMTNTETAINRTLIINKDLRDIMVINQLEDLKIDSSVYCQTQQEVHFL